MINLVPLDIQRHFGVINNKRRLIPPISTTATDANKSVPEYRPVVVDESIVDERRKQKKRRRIYARVEINHRNIIRRKMDKNASIPNNLADEQDNSSEANQPKPIIDVKV